MTTPTAASGSKAGSPGAKRSVPRTAAHRNAAPAGRAAGGGASTTLLRELTGLQAHALVTAGMSTAQAAALLASLRVIDATQFFRALGISERTFQRRAGGRAGVLDANASDRALRLASVLALATRVLGSQEAAERWLTAPAIGLDRHLPLELLQSSEGTALVRTLLQRMDHGVYA
jgi:putative toxin-antitoxin system antitoxin component (TIGR02293 family)